MQRHVLQRLAIVLALALMSIALVPSASSAKPGSDVDETTLPFDAMPGFEDSKRMWGIHNGAGYRVEVPADWNGDLIMWTHSYNVAQGVEDTHALSRRFNGLVAKPDNIYVGGYSMGGHIAAVSAEYYGNTYDGVMPMCGVVGDYELFDYFVDINVAGQHLALGTSETPVDAGQFFGADLPQIKDTFGMSNPWAFALTESGEQFKQLVELESGGDRPNFDEAFNFWFSIDGNSGPGNFVFELGAGDGTVAGGPGVAVDNTDAVYQVDLDPAISDFEAQLNADIARIAHDPQGRSEKGLSNPPSVTGDLNVPVLSMHNLGDLFVPWEMEVEYARNVAAQGNSDMLVQRAIRGVSHCDFTDAEMIEGMSDLINWVENGVRPAGDAVLDPAVVADPEYGCQFSRGFHFSGTPCL